MFWLPIFFWEISHQIIVFLSRARSQPLTPLESVIDLANAPQTVEATKLINYTISGMQPINARKFVSSPTEKRAVRDAGSIDFNSGNEALRVKKTGNKDLGEDESVVGRAAVTFRVELCAMAQGPSQLTKLRTRNKRHVNSQLMLSFCFHQESTPRTRRADTGININYLRPNLTRLHPPTK